MKINIMGGSFGWELAPHNETVWSFNHFILKRPVDVIFNMHDLPAILKNDTTYDRKFVDRVKKGIERVRETNTKMYCPEVWDEIPCERYPIEKIIERFNIDYFSSGPAYAIALALYEGVTDLNLYGISVGITEEYREQKPCLDYWLGVAMAMGVNIGLYGQTELLRTANRQRYGYNTKQIL